MKVYQKLNYGFGGCSEEEVGRLGISLGEYWNEMDIKYLDSIHLDTISSVGRKFLMSKRALLLENGESVVIPRGELAVSMFLGKLAKLYFQWQLERKESLLEKFNTKLYVLRIEIAKRLFSKKFSDKYLFSFKGFSGVALSHGRSVDEILIPEWFGIDIGEKVMVTRDPIQNVVVCLRVTGYTENEIRVNPKTIVFLGGDFDGDKVQVMKLKTIFYGNREYFSCSYEEFENEMNKLIPSNFAYSELAVI